MVGQPNQTAERARVIVMVTIDSALIPTQPPTQFPDMDSSTIALAIVGRDNELATPFDEDCLESQW